MCAMRLFLHFVLAPRIALTKRVRVVCFDMEFAYSKFAFNQELEVNKLVYMAEGKWEL